MDSDSSSQRTLRPYQRAARRAYLVLAVAFLAAIVIQVFLAGAGIFSSGAWLARHVEFVEWFQPLPLFLALAAFVGRMGWFARIAPLAAFAAIVLQYEFAGARPHLVAGLHTVTALVLFWLSYEMTRRSWRWHS